MAHGGLGGENATFEDSWDFRQTGSGARMWTPCILEEGIKLNWKGSAERSPWRRAAGGHVSGSRLLGGLVGAEGEWQ